MAVADPRRGLPAACAGPELRQFFAGGLAALERCAAAIDALNVFPVPDADTGTNLLITARRAALGADACDREAGAPTVARALANAAVRGARGNSGAIFAQLWAGFASALDNPNDAVDAIDTRRWAAAWQAGATAAWASVGSPVEGTLLTVARSTARAAADVVATNAARAAAANAVTTSDADAVTAASADAVSVANADAAANGDADGDGYPGIVDIWQAMVDAADKTVIDTPRLLPILDRAHVVDAGALGLALFLRGGLHAFTGAPLPDPSTIARPSAATRHVIEEAGFARYCTQFTLRVVSVGADRSHLHAAFAGYGESVDIVVDNTGHDASVHVHLHTDRPDETVAHAATLGAVSDVKVEDMEEQRARYASLIDRGQAGSGPIDAGIDTALDPPLDIALVPIVSGDGMRRLFESLLGVVAVVEHRNGSSTIADDLQATLARLTCSEVLVLPNDTHVIEEIRAAVLGCGKEVVIVPTANMPEGVAAALAFNSVDSLAQNVDAMSGAARAVETLAIGPVAESEDLLDAAEAGAIAFASGTSRSQSDTASSAGVDRIALITIYYGAGLSQADADALATRLRRHFPAADLETIEGGQHDCPLWMAFDAHADSSRH